MSVLIPHLQTLHLKPVAHKKISQRFFPQLRSSLPHQLPTCLTPTLKQLWLYSDSDFSCMLSKYVLLPCKTKPLCTWGGFCNEKSTLYLCYPRQRCALPSGQTHREDPDQCFKCNFRLFEGPLWQCVGGAMIYMPLLVLTCNPSEDVSLRKLFVVGKGWMKRADWLQSLVVFQLTACRRCLRLSEEQAFTSVVWQNIRWLLARFVLLLLHKS